MIGNLIGALIFLVLGLVSFIYNKQLAKYFAAQFFTISWWMFPKKSGDTYLFQIYRTTFYAVSVFSLVGVFLFIISLFNQGNPS